MSMLGRSIAFQIGFDGQKTVHEDPSFRSPALKSQVPGHVLRVESAIGLMPGPPAKTAQETHLSSKVHFIFSS